MNFQQLLTSQQYKIKLSFLNLFCYFEEQEKPLNKLSDYSENLKLRNIKRKLFYQFEASMIDEASKHIR